MGALSMIRYAIWVNNLSRLARNVNKRPNDPIIYNDYDTALLRGMLWGKGNARVVAVEATFAGWRQCGKG